MMLHAKYQGSRSFGLGKEGVLMVSLFKTCDPNQSRADFDWNISVLPKKL